MRPIIHAQLFRKRCNETNVREFNTSTILVAIVVVYVHGKADHQRLVFWYIAAKQIYESSIPRQYL